MIRYSFPQFPGIIFNDPEFYLNRVNYYIPTKSCYIEICCDYNGETYSFDFEDFFYEETWNYSQVFEFAMNKINEFKIKE